MSRLFHVACQALGLSALVVASGCLAPGEEGDCETDEDCVGRGEYCETMTSVCLVDDTVPDSTGDIGSGTFGTQPVPFFRGQLCTQMDVLAGSPIPITINPCLHPCLDVKTFKFKHSFSCLGSRCDAWIVQWVEASGMDCPDNVFGQFSPDMCDYTKLPADATELAISNVTQDDGTPIQGQMYIEVPFLSNEDIASIVKNDSSTNINDKIRQYVRKTNRTPGKGTDEPVEMVSGGPEPPAMCNGSENCECHLIGF